MQVQSHTSTGNLIIPAYQGGLDFVRVSATAIARTDGGVVTPLAAHAIAAGDKVVIEYSEQTFIKVYVNGALASESTDLPFAYTRRVRLYSTVATGHPYLAIGPL